MSKAYITVLKVIALLLVFVLGMFSSIAILIGGGVLAADKLTLNRLEKIGINLDTSGLFDDSADKSIRDMSLIQLIKEINGLRNSSDALTLNYFINNYGLIVPGLDKFGFIELFLDKPIMSLFTPEGINDVTADLYIGDLLGYKKAIDDKDPENPREYWYAPATGEEASGIEAVLNDYTVHKIINEGIVIDDLIASEPLGVFLGFVYNEEEGKWYSGGNPVAGVNSYLADKHLNEIDLNGATIGEIMGYTFNEEDGKWYSIADGKPMTGPLQAFAGNTLNNIESGISDAKIGAIMGYEYDTETDTWYKDDGMGGKEFLEGTMLAFADESLKSLPTNIDNKEIGLILGYTYDSDDGVWEDKDGKAATGVEKALAGLKLNNIGTGIQTVKLGDIFGYYEKEGNWYADEDCTVPAKGVMKFMASRTLETVDDDINTEPIGTFLGYDNAGTQASPIWKNNGSLVTGMMKVVASKTFDNVADLEKEYLGTLLGYDNEGTPENPVWKNGTENVTGIMKVISSEKIDTIGTSLETKEIGYFLGYEPVKSGNVIIGWKDSENNDVTGIMKAMANKTFNNIESLTDELTIADLIPDDQRQTGFLLLLNPATTLNGMADEMTRVFTDTTILELVESGAIKLTDAEKEKLASSPIRIMNLSQLLKFALDIPSI